MRKSHLTTLLALSVGVVTLAGCGESNSNTPATPATPAAPSVLNEAPKAPTVKPAEGDAAKAVDETKKTADDSKKAIADDAAKTADSATDAMKAGASELNAEQQSYLDSAKGKLADLKTSVEKFIADKRKDASPETAKLLDELDGLLKKSDTSLADLQAAGAKMWAEKKPQVEAAIKELVTKFGEAKAKTALGGVEIPGMGK